MADGLGSVAQELLSRHWVAALMVVCGWLLAYVARAPAGNLVIFIVLVVPTRFRLWLATRFAEQTITTYAGRTIPAESIARVEAVQSDLMALLNAGAGGAARGRRARALGVLTRLGTRVQRRRALLAVRAQHRALMALSYRMKAMSADTAERSIGNLYLRGMAESMEAASKQ